MSLYQFLASDKPLKNVMNKKVQTLTINEALKKGIVDDTSNFDNSLVNSDEDKVILYSNSEKDFNEIEITEDNNNRYAAPFTNKKYISEIRWKYSTMRAEQLIEYIRDHLTIAEDIELWNTWRDNISQAEVKKITACDLFPRLIKDIFGKDYYSGQPTCLIIQKDLSMQNHYESFYDMVEKNDVFAQYCREVFGIDFSQDGFSDINQINDLIRFADIKPGTAVLDIGCGNGKMAEYISDKTSAIVVGFDNSKTAIDSARSRTQNKPELHFEKGAIGEKQYHVDMFDVVLSVDTMYFAPDLNVFVGQIREWLKPGGIFIAYFGEGPEEKISEDENNTELALALMKNKLPYKVVDYTKEHYELMKRKREAAINMKEQFMMNDTEFLYTNIINQSIDKDTDYESFKKTFNRNLYIAKKSV